ncbi:hypothetical protein BDY21DRAFT_423962 [Lineolata rhizophorae]|uniref:Uncharacterized protein n=1 Tax=Lineolata rhizophorae TaxID=578093 RepID=A0A6A6NRL1_9PEZI|nr:hypothetical protein BDY21DRAFT_423962 [Lineolata rhizophorae]
MSRPPTPVKGRSRSPSRSSSPAPQGDQEYIQGAERMIETNETAIHELRDKNRSLTQKVHSLRVENAELKKKYRRTEVLLESERMEMERQSKGKMKAREDFKNAKGELKDVEETNKRLLGENKILNARKKEAETRLRKEMKRMTENESSAEEGKSIQIELLRRELEELMEQNKGLLDKEEKLGEQLAELRHKNEEYKRQRGDFRSSASESDTEDLEEQYQEACLRKADLPKQWEKSQDWFVESALKDDIIDLLHLRPSGITGDTCGFNWIERLVFGLLSLAFLDLPVKAPFGSIARVGVAVVATLFCYTTYKFRRNPFWVEVAFMGILLFILCFIADLAFQALDYPACRGVYGMGGGYWLPMNRVCFDSSSWVSGLIGSLQFYLIEHPKPSKAALSRIRPT